MTSALDVLVDLLDLEDIEVNIFRGVSPDETRQRVFGGQVAAQALIAAGRTVDAGTVHSLHSYFLRPGDPTVPILYEVDRIRDGRSFTTRRVVAIQHGRAIFNLACSFHVPEEGLFHQEQMPEAPPPEGIPTVRERVAALGDQLADFFKRPNPIDQRFVGELPWLRSGSREPKQQLWMKADGTLPDDPLLHAAVVTYASDMTLFDSILHPHEIRWEDDLFMGASLDHCMWFHRPLRADQWLLFDQDSPTASGARGLARGTIWSADGRLVVSVMQEGLVRLISRAPKGAEAPEALAAPPQS
ncbi:MAG TPA: acyl-CoA thioesterase II [Acidimicrobiales bacterium]|nr:acyl-CoA thioesterase II [Acidimicrobiales bacterium]